MKFSLNFKYTKKNSSTFRKITTKQKMLKQAEHSTDCAQDKPIPVCRTQFDCVVCPHKDGYVLMIMHTRVNRIECAMKKNNNILENQPSVQCPPCNQHSNDQTQLNPIYCRLRVSVQLQLLLLYCAILAVSSPISHLQWKRDSVSFICCC